MSAFASAQYHPGGFRQRALAWAGAMAAAVALILAAAGPAHAQADRYIVVLNDSVSQPGAVADEHRRRFGTQPTHVYRHALKGYAAVISDHRVDDVRADARVSFVDDDEPVAAFAQQLPTGVERIFADTNASWISTAATTSASTSTSR